MKLEDLNKKNIFNTPDGYFDQLPSRIQNRVTEHKSTWETPVVKYGLRYALPAILLVVLVYFSVRMDNNENTDLTGTTTVELIEYLSYNEVTTEQIHEVYNLDNHDLKELFSEDLEFGEEVLQDELLKEDLELLLDTGNMEDI